MSLIITCMLKNYVKLAWRNLWKNKAFSVINIFGLSVGIAFTMLIGAYIWDQLQVNHHLKNSDNQYILTGTPAPLPKTLRTEYPNLVANYYRYDGISTNISKGDKHFRGELQVGDSTLLKMYGFKLVSGDARTALNDPFSVVITTDMALKYFGKTDVAGQTLNFENFSGEKHDFTVTGVLYKLPENSVTHLIENSKTGFFLPLEATKYFNRGLDGWDNINMAGYIELQKGININALNKAIADIVRRNVPEQIRKTFTIAPVPLKEFYLTNNNGLVKKMNYTLGSIALFILLMAVLTL